MREILKEGDSLEFVAVLAPGCDDGFFRVGEYPEVDRFAKVVEIVVVSVAGGAGWARWAEVKFEGDRSSEFVNLAHVCWCRLRDEDPESPEVAMTTPISPGRAEELDAATASTVDLMDRDAP